MKCKHSVKHLIGSEQQLAAMVGIIQQQAKMKNEQACTDLCLVVIEVKSQLQQNKQPGKTQGGAPVEATDSITPTGCVQGCRNAVALIETGRSRDRLE